MKKYVPVIVAAIIVLFTAYSTYYVSDALNKGVFCALSLPIPLFIPLFFILGLVVGAIFTWLYSISSRSGVDLESIARLFDREEEWFIVRSILERGSVLQSEVSERFGKVRASRAVAALEAKEIIRRERVGKTYVILAGPVLMGAIRRHRS